MKCFALFVTACLLAGPLLSQGYIRQGAGSCGGGYLRAAISGEPKLGGNIRAGWPFGGSNRATSAWLVLGPPKLEGIKFGGCGPGSCSILDVSLIAALPNMGSSAPWPWSYKIPNDPRFKGAQFWAQHIAVGAFHGPGRPSCVGVGWLAKIKID